MLIGISRPSWEKQDSEQIFRLAKNYRFDGVQVKPQQYDAIDLDPELFKKLHGDCAYLARAGIIVYLGPNIANGKKSFRSSFISSERWAANKFVFARMYGRKTWIPKA